MEIYRCLRCDRVRKTGIPSQNPCIYCGNNYLLWVNHDLNPAIGMLTEPEYPELIVACLQCDAQGCPRRETEKACRMRKDPQRR